MSLSKERVGEIAHEVLRAKVRGDGVRVDEHFRHRVGMMAKETGISFPELLAFSVAEVTEILNQVARLDEPQTDEEVAMVNHCHEHHQHHDHHHHGGHGGGH